MLFFLVALIFTYAESGCQYSEGKKYCSDGNACGGTYNGYCHYDSKYGVVLDQCAYDVHACVDPYVYISTTDQALEASVAIPAPHGGVKAYNANGGMNTLETAVGRTMDYERVSDARCLMRPYTAHHTSTTSFGLYGCSKKCYEQSDCTYFGYKEGKCWTSTANDYGIGSCPPFYSEEVYRWTGTGPSESGRRNENWYTAMTIQNQGPSAVTYGFAILGFGILVYGAGSHFLGKKEDEFQAIV